MCQISSTVGYRLGKQLHRIVPIFEQFTSLQRAGFDDNGERDDDVEEPDNEDVTNELRESCFNGFSSFVTRCPIEVQAHLPNIIKTSSAFIKFDPNYTYDSDEEEEDNDEDMEDKEVRTREERKTAEGKDGWSEPTAKAPCLIFA